MDGERVDGGIAGEAKAPGVSHNAKEDVTLRQAADGLASEVTRVYSGNRHSDVVTLLLAFAAAILAKVRLLVREICADMLRGSVMAMEERYGRRVSALEARVGFDEKGDAVLPCGFCTRGLTSSRCQVHGDNRPGQCRTTLDPSAGPDSSARVDGPLPLAERAIGSRVLSAEEHRWLALRGSFTAEQAKTIEEWALTDGPPTGARVLSAEERQWLSERDPALQECQERWLKLWADLDEDEEQFLLANAHVLSRVRGTSPDATTAAERDLIKASLPAIDPEGIESSIRRMACCSSPVVRDVMAEFIVDALARRHGPTARAALHAEAPPMPLGDTPDDISAADHWARQMMGGCTAETRGKIWATSTQSASNLRGLFRYLEAARAVAVTRAAELDQAQGRGSWAHAWTPEQVKPVLRALAKLFEIAAFPPGPTATERRPCSIDGCVREVELDGTTICTGHSRALSWVTP